MLGVRGGTSRRTDPLRAPAAAGAVRSQRLRHHHRPLTTSPPAPRSMGSPRPPSAPRACRLRRRAWLRPRRAAALLRRAPRTAPLSGCSSNCSGARMPSRWHASPESMKWSLGAFTTRLRRFRCHGGTRNTTKLASSTESHARAVLCDTPASLPRPSRLSSWPVRAAARRRNVVNESRLLPPASAAHRSVHR
jgi:hypothetical protein